jgi:hypothetical protein
MVPCRHVTAAASLSPPLVVPAVVLPQVLMPLFCAAATDLIEGLMDTAEDMPLDVKAVHHRLEEYR